MMKVTLGLSALALMAPGIAAAQDPGGPEIVVTARKRTESILNVPVVESVLPQAQLERLQTQELKDVATRVPGLSIGTAVGSVGTQVSLRGVGTSSLNAGIDQSVSLNLDGLQLSQGLAYSSGLFDVAQIEILKGPQTLFYGKSSPGGVISLRTADPTDRFEVIGRGGYEFEANERRGELVLSGPLTRTLGLRIAGLYDQADGFFRNDAIAFPNSGARTPDQRANPATKSYVIRGTAVWKPAAEINARLKVNIAKDKTFGGNAAQYVSCPDGVSAPSGVPYLGGGENCKLDRTLRYVYMDPSAFPGSATVFPGGVREGGTPFQRIDQKFGTLEINFNFIPHVTVTSTSGYYQLKSDSSINGLLTTYAGTPLVSDNTFRRKDYTQELRANSNFAGPLDFTVGAFFQDAKVINLSTQLGNITRNLPPILGKFEHDLSIYSFSTFAQLRYRVTDRLELAAGARYTNEQRKDLPFLLTSGVSVPFRIARQKISAKNVAPEFTVTYKPSGDMTLFASYKKGFKSGSFNLNSLSVPGQDIAFGDERVQGAEAGIKARAFERRLSVDVAGYYYDYRGLQVGASSPVVNSLPEIRTLNAGSAKVYGVDFTLAYRPPQVDGLNLLLSGEWNHARFQNLVGVPCWGGQTIAEGCNQVLNPATGRYTGQDLGGTPLVRAPDWQLTVGFDYSLPVSSSLNLVFTNENHYSSRYLRDLGLRDDFYQSGYWKYDASVALRDSRNRWELALIGKNLADRLTSGNCTNLNAANGVAGGQITGGTTRGPAGVDELACFVDRGRQVFLRLTLRPFG